MLRQCIRSCRKRHMENPFSTTIESSFQQYRQGRLHLQRICLPCNGPIQNFHCYNILQGRGSGFCLNTYTSVHGFKTSSSRYVNPLIWVVLRPAAKLLAALTGRSFRKWWKELPPDKKKYFLQELRRNRMKILLATAVSCAIGFAYYQSHLEYTPITGRKRFMTFDAKQFRVIAEAEFKQVYEEFKHKILSERHPHTRRVHAVVQQLLRANADMEELKGKVFSIAVIAGDLENAFVLPNGEIFVFEGMLNICSNNDQLGAVLAHELSHCILAHGAENFSFVHLIDFLMVFLIVVIWSVLPSDVTAVFMHWLVKQLIDVAVHLPYNRKIETEADEVGLNLAAKACFDVRENSAFWTKMALLSKTYDLPSIEFLSTHPSHDARSSHLDGLMDKAIELRTTCGCPKLKPYDPRQDVERLTKLLEAERRKYLPHRPVVVVSSPIPSR